MEGESLSLAHLAFLLGALALEHNALELFEDDELLVGMVDLGIALFFRDQETSFLETLELALDVTGIFFNELSETTNMCLEVRILGIDHNDLAANSAGDKYV
jgi:hypothetical protein